MSDRDDRKHEEDGLPKDGQTLIRGRNKPPSDANDDATVLNSEEKPRPGEQDRESGTGEANDDATRLRPKTEVPAAKNADETLLRKPLQANSPKEIPVLEEPADDATQLRADGVPAGDSDAGDETILRQDNDDDTAASGDATVLRPPESSGNAEATVLRAPGEGNATILRSGQDGRAERPGSDQPRSTDNATILREPGEEGSTILRAPGHDGGEATILRVADGDDDRTVLNDDIDDDSTIMGPGANGQDTTYIASVGKQIRPQGNSEAGRLLKNRFVLEEKIGSGGMGDVYKALDLRQQEAQERDPYIAIKLLNENFSRHKDAFLSLQRETSRTRGIPHPNIMGVYDFDREGDTVFMSMELLDGKPLDDYLKEHPEGVSEEDAWNIIDGISKGLMRAHDAGIVHSDFKPGNIFYTTDKTAKVFDFGIARAVSNPNELESDGEKTVFDAGSLGALTPTYASYEMLKGMEPSKSDDVYAVALVAYELFMGKHPYERVPADKALERGLKPKPVPFLKRRHWRALRKALELKGEDRTQTIDEFYEGVFSKDPPYFRYAAVATLLLGSIGFGAFQTLNVKEKPGELVEFEDSIAASKVTLRTIDTPRWESEVWHENLAKAMDRFRFANSQILENQQWVEDWEYVSDPEVKSFATKIVGKYIEKIGELRNDAASFAPDTREGVEGALERLKQAQMYAGYMDNYRAADAGGVQKERERLERQLNTRNDRLAAIAEAEQRAEEARLLAEQKARENAERVAFEEARLASYDGYLEEARHILRCKSDVSNAEIDRFGELLSLMRNEWREAYDHHYPTLVSYMGTCIQQRIGLVNPERAREVKAMVTTYMPGESRISSLIIEDKDPCDERKLVGRGNRNRSWCTDKLAEGGVGPELVVVPPLTVRNEDYKFAISRAEIKIGEYNQFCEKTGCAQLTGNISLPATNISVSQANAYTDWLSSQTGQHYRLPKVKEWRHAATVQRQETDVDENINCTVDSRGVRLGETLLNAVSGRSNSWGLYNYVGNAQEWAYDGEDTLLALGGAHKDPRQECNVDRSVAHGGQADPYTGFRVVREIEHKKAIAKKSEVAASG